MAPKKLKTGVLPLLLTLLYPLAFLHVGADSSADDLERLQLRKDLEKLLGIDDLGVGSKPITPPEFTIKLYNVVTDPTTGTIVRRYPYNADMVRSFYETASLPSSDRYYFHINELGSNERLLGAELHLYITKIPETKNSTTDESSNYTITISVYRVLDEKNLTSLQLQSLLISRELPSNASKWQVFDVKETVLDWINGAPNLGFLVIVRNSLEEQVQVDFRRGNENDPKQPVLVLFNNEGTYAEELPDVMMNWEIMRLQEVCEQMLSRRKNISAPFTSMEIYQDVPLQETQKMTEVETQSRGKRDVMPLQDNLANFDESKLGSSSLGGECKREGGLYVNFTSIGMPAIIKPSGYLPYKCLGTCGSSLSNTPPTNYATIQSIFNKSTESTQTFPCVPTQFSDLTIFYIKNKNVVQKIYKDMIVEHCGCR